MARVSKVYLNYSGFEEKYLQSISGADDTDLKILGALFLLATPGGAVELSDIERVFSIDHSDLSASVKYWKGAGVLTETSTKKSSCFSETQAAHKNGVLTHSGVESYTNDELARVLQKCVSTGFVDEAQKALGKIFNKNEVAKLVGIVEQLGFEEEAVLAILSYCVRLEKKSVSYAEKIAVSFHDEDISTAEQVHAQIDYLERRNSAMEKIRGLYGFGGRALTSTEKKLFVTWTESYGFDFEIIKKAYEITVDTIQTPAPKYTDKILTKWYQNGLTELQEIDEFIEKEKQARAGKASVAVAKKPSSKQDDDLEDWFEQRLKQTFGE